MAQRKHRSGVIEDAARRPSSPSAPSLEGAVTEQLTDRFALRELAEVIAYLDEFPHLAPLLEATEVIPRYFGSDAQLLLEVFTDPESEADDRMLFALVRTNLDPDARLDRLFQLEDDWWLSVSPNPPARLVIDIE